jgi:hypothetical protein
MISRLWMARAWVRAGEAPRQLRVMCAVGPRGGDAGVRRERWFPPPRLPVPSLLPHIGSGRAVWLLIFLDVACAYDFQPKIQPLSQ